MKNKREMRKMKKRKNNFNQKLMLIGIVGLSLILITSFIFIVSALSDNEKSALQNELSQLESNLTSQGYSWLIDNQLNVDGGVQKARSLMDRAFVSLTNRCGFENTLSKVPPCLHVSSNNPENTNLNNVNKKENPSYSLMDRAPLTIDGYSMNNKYINLVKYDEN
jgi:hypothetical protein